MNEDLKNLLFLYLNVAVSSNIVSGLKLVSLFLKAKKNADKLIYDKNLSYDSKWEMSSNYVAVLSDLLVMFKDSLIPLVGGVYNVLEVYDTDKETYEYYLSMINESIETINEYETLEREEVAKKLKQVYEEFKEVLPDTCMGHKIDAETIRISEKELKSFLRKYGIKVSIKYDDEFNKKLIIKTNKHSCNL